MRPNVCLLIRAAARVCAQVPSEQLTNDDNENDDNDKARAIEQSLEDRKMS